MRCACSLLLRSFFKCLPHLLDIAPGMPLSTKMMDVPPGLPKRIAVILRYYFNTHAEKASKQQ